MLFTISIQYKLPKSFKLKKFLLGPIDEPEDPDWNPESEVKRESREDDEFENEEDFKFDDEEEGEEEEIGMNTKKRGKKKRTRRDSISSQDKPKGAPTGNFVFQK